MARYLVEPKYPLLYERILRILSFTKNININLSRKNSQKRVNCTKTPATDSIELHCKE